MIPVWHGWPSAEILTRHFNQHHATTGIIVADHWLSDVSDQYSDEWLALLHQAALYYQHQPVFCLPFIHGSRLLLIQPDMYASWHQRLPDWIIPHLTAEHHLIHPADATKPWLDQPEPIPAKSVVIIGAGIAGAATAYALAQHQVAVTVLDQSDVATAASGNQQGLLYAKISAHDTIQSELLLAGYGYSQILLTQTMTGKTGWNRCGVLHVDHNSAEYQRNRLLAQQHPESTLYQWVSAQKASQLAGLPLTTGGLWWPHGVALNPRLWCMALLDHPLITVHTHSKVTRLDALQNHWRVQYQAHGRPQKLSASHVVLCMGAYSDTLSPTLHWPFQFIRGQTTVSHVNPHTMTPQCALSGHSYITPAWQNQLCFGATFHPNNRHDALTYADQEANQQQLAQWLPELARSLPQITALQGHAAIRCDAFDHLPVVGAIGDSRQMRQVYAQLALDKNYRLNAPCPWQQGIFINTAHGSRGLTTAPLCAEAIACAILGLPSPLSTRLQQALHPNRLIIRSISHHLPWHGA
ncbi:FAD-dependent 5-carboxymethylaminomethyl-2-thiouridine(34) oxidoreductase MnmC [Neisseriaceae bacterium ESL0693]|nr:FAD-dependent 5-carboxymethylaminomethyl-2-thiouridine(34) oxidoreductase MnmC [Neisseriaceae bacterium ESL0693]